MFIIKPLNQETWSDFELLAQKHNGVWGGCWCIWFHQSNEIKRGNPQENKELKKQLVFHNQSHAALVFDQDKAIAWCQFGSPKELPAIYHKKKVETDDYIFPDWRITCIFVDNNYRNQGVAKIAVEGALSLIRNAGGGVVEAYPQNTQGKMVPSSFLYNGTQTLFESCGFQFFGDKGKNHSIMRIQL
jgi:ribosomal protein S18 acetylase RimI-like enzyme